MIHRHLDHPAGTPVDELGAAALDDLLDRGDLAGWAPLARVVMDDPWGSTAERVLALCEAHPMYGVSPLWRALIAGRRQRAEVDLGELPRLPLTELRRSSGMSQVAIGQRLGMNQSEVSRLERRSDLRLSTLRAFVAAAGARLQLLVTWPALSPRGGAGVLEIGEPSPISPPESRRIDRRAAGREKLRRATGPTATRP